MLNRSIQNTHNAMFAYKLKAKAKQSAMRLRAIVIDIESVGLAIVNKAKTGFAAAKNLHPAPVAVETNYKNANDDAKNTAGQPDLTDIEEFSPVWRDEVSMTERATFHVAGRTASTSQVTLINVAEPSPI
ncbi:hypothetical protein IWW42_005748 [Coemansia sp. RSA 1085]|nr:hypothetical protein IWW42_005748 [Coemansia sp. RSA 1085]